MIKVLSFIVPSPLEAKHYPQLYNLSISLIWFPSSRLGTSNSLRSSCFATFHHPLCGYEVKALGPSIFTQGETLEEVREAVKDAVRCHFEDDQMPRIIRLATAIRQSFQL
jgi:hypothetical protein